LLKLIKAWSWQRNSWAWRGLENTLRSASPLASHRKSENHDAENGIHRGFTRVPASIENGEKAVSPQMTSLATGLLCKDNVIGLTPPEIVEKVHRDFLMVTAILQDQSRTGPRKWKFADYIL
jgi:hypothetical protein